MTLEKALEIINKYLKIQGIKERVLLTMDKQTAWPLYRASAGYSTTLLKNRQYAEGKELNEADMIIDGYFCAKSRAAKKATAQIEPASSTMNPEQAIALLNQCLVLLKSEKQITLDIEPSEGIGLCGQAIGYSKVLIQEGRYDEFGLVNDAYVIMSDYLTERREQAQVSLQQKVQDVQKMEQRLQDFQQTIAQYHDPKYAASDTIVLAALQQNLDISKSNVRSSQKVLDSCSAHLPSAPPMCQDDNPPTYYEATQSQAPQQQYQSPTVAPDPKALKAAIKTLNSFRKDHKELKKEFEEPSEKKLLSEQLQLLIVAAQQKAVLLSQDKKIKPKDYDALVVLMAACELITTAIIAQRPVVQQQPMLHSYPSQTNSATVIQTVTSPTKITSPKPSSPKSSPPRTYGPSSARNDEPSAPQFSQVLFTKAQNKASQVDGSFAESLGFNETEILQAFAVINALPIGMKLDFNSDVHAGFSATDAVSDYFHDNWAKIDRVLGEKICPSCDLLNSYFRALETATKGTVKKALKY